MNVTRQPSGRSRMSQTLAEQWPTDPRMTEVTTGVEPQADASNPTTGFLTATTFIYALGAGITAAAGTRLALQWIISSVY
jgi:hypothetical protein